MATPTDIARVLQILKFRVQERHDNSEDWGRRDGKVDVSVFDNGQWIISKEEMRERGKGARELVTQLKGFLEVRVQELTGTGAVGGFGTPYAFSTKKPISSNPKKRNNGYTVSEASNDKILKRFDNLVEAENKHAVLGDIARIVKILNSKGRKTDASNLIRSAHKFLKAGDETMLVKTRETAKMILRSIQEGGDPYYAWRNDETTTPRQKIGGVISEMNKQLGEMEKVVKRSQRLKTELGVPNSGLWKRTNNALMKIESRMHRISQTIRNMRG